MKHFTQNMLSTLLLIISISIQNGHAQIDSSKTLQYQISCSYLPFKTLNGGKLGYDPFGEYGYNYKRESGLECSFGIEYGKGWSNSISISYLEFLSRHYSLGSMTYLSYYGFDPLPIDYVAGPRGTRYISKNIGLRFYLHKRFTFFKVFSIIPEVQAGFNNEFAFRKFGHEQYIQNESYHTDFFDEMTTGLRNLQFSFGAGVRMKINFTPNVFISGGCQFIAGYIPIYGYVIAKETYTNYRRIGLRFPVGIGFTF